MICLLLRTHAVRPAKIQSVNSLINIVQGLVLKALEQNMTEQWQSEKSSIVIVYLTAWSVDALTAKFILLKFWKLLADETFKWRTFFLLQKNPASSGPSELSDNTVYPIMHLVIRDVLRVVFGKWISKKPAHFECCLSVTNKRRRVFKISTENEMSYSWPDDRQ